MYPAPALLFKVIRLKRFHHCFISNIQDCTAPPHTVFQYKRHLIHTMLKSPLPLKTVTIIIIIGYL